MAATAVSPTLTCSVLCQGNKPTVAVAHPWRAAPSPAFLSPAKVLFHPTAHPRRSRGCPLSFTRARLGCRLRAAAGDAGRTRPSSAEGTTTPEHVEAEPAFEAVTTLRIIRFVLPTLGIWIMNPVLSLVDTAVVGQHSALELAAMGPSVMLCDHLGHVFNFLAVATTNLLSLAFAANDKAQAEQVLSESLMAALILAAISGAALFVFAPPCMAAMAGSGSGSTIVPAATTYCRFRAIGHVAGVVATVLQV